MRRQLYPGHSQLFLSPGRALYCGPIQYLETHAYGADVLHVGIYGPFRILLEGSAWHVCRCAVVPAGVRHSLDMAGGVHGKLFVERDGRDAAAFRRRFPHDGKQARLFQDEEAVACFHWIHETDPSSASVEVHLDLLLQAEQTEPVAPDERVLRIIQMILCEPERNFSQAELARATDLSPSRCLHLFRQQTGLPYRRFRLWKRLLLALEHMHGIDSLTRAAQDSGFADATHFSHSFRAVFGVNPAPVFRYISRFEVEK